MSQIFYYLLQFSMSKYRTFDITHSPNLSLCPIKCLSSVRQMLGKIEVSACPKFHFLLIRVVQICPYVLSNVCRLSGKCWVKLRCLHVKCFIYEIHLPWPTIIPLLTSSLTCMLFYVFMNFYVHQERRFQFKNISI